MGKVHGNLLMKNFLNKKIELINATENIFIDFFKRMLSKNFVAFFKKDSFFKNFNINNSLIEKALHVANSQNGPVHINAPFSEPLYETVEEDSDEVEMIKIKKGESTVSLASSIIKKWHSSKRKMILVGVNAPDSVKQVYLDLIGEDPSIVVLTETTSNLHHSNFFPSIDQLISPLDATDYEALRPEILLTFGGMVVSKKIKTFFLSIRFSLS